MSSSKLILFLAPLALACAAHAGDLTTGLVAYWDFESGTANSPAASGGSAFNGKAVGSAVTGTDAKIGKGALQLDGVGAYVHVAGHFDVTRAWTVSAWFKTDSAPAGASRQSVYESTGNFSMSFGLRASTGTSATPGSVNTQVSLISKNAKYLVLNHEMAAADLVGKWHHIAEVYTPPTEGAKGSLIAYLDGRRTSSIALPAGDVLQPSDGFNIGTYREATGRWFRGSIDEVAVWNRSISETEAAELYRKGEAGESLAPAAPVPAATATAGPGMETSGPSGSKKTAVFSGAGLLGAVACSAVFFIRKRRMRGDGLPPPPGH